jgi:gliding motility-associated-like protein
MKALLLLITTILFNGLIFSQTTTFRINYDQALLDLPGNATESLTNNQYIFAGTNLSFLPYGTVTELDANGDLIWSKRYSDGSFGFQLNDIKKDQANNEYYLCGGSESNAGVFMRLDAAGNVVVTTKFEINEADGAFLNRVIKTSDGGYVAVGYVTGHDPDGGGAETYFGPISYTDDSGDPQTETIGSPLIVKFDANGNHLWHHVTRYYTAASRNPGERIYNDASFKDVVETADGYMAVGQYDVNQHLSNTNSDGDDATATDALIFKTDLSGNVSYHRQVDNPSTNATQNSKYLSAISKTSVGDPIAAGGDNSRELIMKYGATGAFSLTFSRLFRYSGSFFGTDPVDVSQIYEINGGTDLVTMGMYIRTFSFEFSNSLHRMNASATTNTWAKKYTFGLVSLLPRGQQTSDGGFIMASTTTGISYDYQIIKTDPNGDTPLIDCPPGTFTPTASAGPTTIATPHHRVFSGTPAPNGLTVAVVNINPTQTVICRTIECTPPPLATTVTAALATICAGQSSSITASGPGTNVSYNVYDAASGGTNLGGTPLSVSPGTTTTYYVETVDDSDPNCVSTGRVAVTVTVNPIPAANPASNTPLCVGDNLNLTTDNVSGATYSWTGPNGFTSSLEDPTINNVILAADGTYSLTVTANGCSNGPVTTDVTINNSPTATAGATNTTICSGDDINLTGNTIAGGTYSWTGPNGFTSSSEDPVITGATVTADGTYSLTITLGSCTSNTATVDITVDPTPTATPGALATTICEGDDIELTANTVTGATYSWTGPNGFTSGSEDPTISGATVAAGGTYSLTITLGSCGSTTSTVDVTVNPTPTATAGAINTTICSGDDIELTGNTVTGATYSWTGPNGFTSTNQNPTISGAGTNADGTYNLTITLGSCVSNTAAVDVTINTSPTVSAGATATAICEGDNIALNATAVAGGTYSWTGPNGFTSGNQNPTINNATATEGGTYSLTVTVSGCSSASSTVDVAVNPTPTATAGATSTVICSGDDIELTGNTVAGGTYSWTGPNGFTSSNQNPTISGAGTNADGTYNLTITLGSCVSNTATVDVTVNETPSNNANATSTEVCEGGSIELTANTITGATYSWTGPNGFTSTNQNPTIPNATAAEAGTYSLTITANGCPSASADVIVSVNAPASLTIVGTDISCNGLTDGGATVTPTGNAPFSYNWSPSGGSSISASNLAAGPYTVVVTDNNGCESSETVTINEPDGIALTASSTQSQCTVDDGSATVSASGGTGTFTYLWTPSGQTTAAATGIGAGSYVVEVTDDNNCTATATVIVESLNGPTVTIIDQQNVSCIGADDGFAEAEATGGTPGYTYSWSPNGGNQATSTGLGPDTYTIQVTDNAGCTAITTVGITAPDALTISETITAASCGQTDGAIVVNVSGGTPSYTYDWSPSVGNTSTIGNLSGGSYALTVTDANGCQISQTYTVAVNGALPIDITPPSATIDAGTSVDLDVITNPGVSGESYTWTPGEGLSFTDCPDPNATPNETTTYYVEVTTPDGCSAMDSIVIVVNQPCGDLFVPNIFSPNNDGNNDMLCVYGGCIAALEFQIYNRWGELIFTTNDNTECWDGTQNGEPVNTGVYVYKLTVTFNGEEVQKSGNINVVR